MAKPKPKPKKRTARQKLERSQLKLDQQELMGKDVDLDGFYVRLSAATGIQMIDNVMSADVERTIDGASTLTVTIADADGNLLNSKLLHNRCDVQVDGLWFRLCKLGRTAGQLTLTFEDREIAVLRTYNSPIKQSKKTSRNKGVTRAEFILRLIREVSGPDRSFAGPIPYVIPDLHKVQPVEKQYDTETDVTDPDETGNNRGYEVAVMERVIIKGNDARKDQVNNINDILDTGLEMGMPNKVLIMALMCCIQESSITNLRSPTRDADNYRSADIDKNPKGCFQQIKYYGWPASGNVKIDARAFFKKAIQFYKRNPSGAFHILIEEVQHSGLPDLYKPHRWEAEYILEAYYGQKGPKWAKGDYRRHTKGGTDKNKDKEPIARDLAQQLEKWFSEHGGDEKGDKEYEFFRGKPEVRGKKVVWFPESSWAAIQRLAEEVNKKAFFVSGTFYYISETELFKSKARMTLSEDSLGVNWIDFDWDIGKSEATCTISCQMDRWAAPPGTVIKLTDMGVVTGRWLVHSVERSLYEKEGIISLIKPSPQLPEPGATNIEKTEDPSQLQFHLQDPDDVTGDPKDYWTRMAPGADRADMHTKTHVKRFVSKIAHIYGQPLTITCGTNHNQFTTTGNVSDHWSGDAADIGMMGDQLTRLGQAALIAAGMPAKQARRERGGKYKTYQVGGWQIIFNSTIGGNHYNHLHVGGTATETNYSATRPG